MRDGMTLMYKFPEDMPLCIYEWNQMKTQQGFEIGLLNY
jgi:hypothetical protein